MSRLGLRLTFVCPRRGLSSLPCTDEQCCACADVLFSTFFDKGTTDHLLPPRGSSGPAIKFPPEMRAALPAERQSLFDWHRPTAEQARSAVAARIAKM